MGYANGCRRRKCRQELAVSGFNKKTLARFFGFIRFHLFAIVLCVFPTSIQLPDYLPVSLTVLLSLCLTICLSVHLSVCLVSSLSNEMNFILK